jgi:hypothetical protein
MPDPKPDSTRTTSATIVQDQPSEKGAAAVKDDTKKVGGEDAKPIDPASDKAQAEPSSEPSAPKDSKPKGERDGAEPASDKPAANSSLPGYESKHSMFPSWFKGLFGQTSKLSNDWESQTLEAYMIPENSQTLLKVPFGHQSLAQGLKKMKKQCLPWDQYTALGSQHHKRINQAVLEAKRLDSRERTCVAIGLNKEFGSERIMLFFLVGATVEPIHFKDAVGRKFSFPYEQSRTWPVRFPSRLRGCPTDRYS